LIVLLVIDAGPRGLLTFNPQPRGYSITEQPAYVMG